ncbi:Uncharacterised protein [Escherichia coli]|nr:Uncharacterised protein [Escherichia coli]CAD5751561.1 Uncharacterised protein [Escherichia coli]
MHHDAVNKYACCNVSFIFVEMSGERQSDNGLG